MNIVFAVLLILPLACDKVNELTRFTMKYEAYATVPSSLVVDTPLSIPTPDITTNASSTFSSNNTNADLVQEILLSALSLEVSSPQGEDFSFLKSISIFLNAEGLPEVKIAWADNVPNDAGTILELETSGENLKEYIVKDKFSLRVNTVTDEIIGTDHEIKINSEFLVDAKILGI